MSPNIFKRLEEAVKPAEKKEPQSQTEIAVEEEGGVEASLIKRGGTREIKILPSGRRKVQGQVVKKTLTHEEIEAILSEGLDRMYGSMDERTREEFRAKGEETATKIEELVSTFKLTVKKVLDLIRDWLKLIPHINKFFLEQEAKIKTDKIITLAKKEKLKNKIKL